MEREYRISPAGVGKDVYFSCDNEVHAEERMLELRYQQQRELYYYFKEQDKKDENIR